MTPDPSMQTADSTASTAIVIRPASLADAVVLADLLEQLGYPTQPQEITQRLGRILPRPNWQVAVALCEGRVAGVIAASREFFFERDGSYGRVHALSVAEDRRGRGIGAALLSHVEQWLRSAGAIACIVCSHTRRTDAHRFYQREGYQVTGVRFVKDL